MAKWYPGRRLSWFRVSILVVVIGAITFTSMYGVDRWQDEQQATERSPWFDAYVDVTATPSYPFETPPEDGQKNVTLAFIVSDLQEGCTPAWGGVYTLDEAEGALDLDRRLARLRLLGGSAMVSFGGQANSDLSLTCDDDDALVDGYSSVIERYELGSIDMDIEGDMLEDAAAVERQAAAIAATQERRASKDGLDVWLTLPVAADGLTFDGLRAVRTYLKAGVDLAGVNVMTMNYNSETKTKVYDNVQSSLEATQNQLRSLYQEAGAPLGEATAWSMVSATPMIGQNDVRKEVFSLEDAGKLARFAEDRGMVRMSMWSLNRDKQCDANWPDPKTVSDSCSGVTQKVGEFSETLREFRTGAIAQVAEELPDNPVQNLDDDPATSPYQIWSADVAYTTGTKVVWHRSVYEAKWWTQDDQPDQATESGAQPWRLLGPVLPGEKPIERPTLPDGFYPAWQKDSEYRRGDRVIFEGIGYVAKWWSVGDSPDASLVQPDQSPWRQLTDEEVTKLLGKADQNADADESAPAEEDPQP